MRTLTVAGSWQNYTLNDVEAVRFASGILDISEYQVFKLAYREWFRKDLSDHTMEYRFDNYIEDEVVPLWVWNFVQKVIDKHEKGELDPTEYGIKRRTLSETHRKLRWLYVLLFIIFGLCYCWMLTQIPPYVEMSFG